MTVAEDPRIQGYLSFTRFEAMARAVHSARPMITHQLMFVAATPGAPRIAPAPSSISSWKPAARRALSSAVLVGGLGILIGCAATPACRKGAKGDVVMGARTAGEAVKTGAKTGVEGVKTAGRAVGGWVEGGSKEAEEEWNKGKQETKATAHEGAADVDREASVPLCAD